METPATSDDSTVTMIAPKRAVMIDDPTRAFTPLAHPGPEALAHPAHTSRASGGQARRAKSLPDGRRVPKKAPVTCCTCRVTYLPSAISPASTSPEDWVCDICRPTVS